MQVNDAKQSGSQSSARLENIAIRGFCLLMVALAIGGGWYAYDFMKAMGVDVGCRSDALSTVARHLREFAEANEDRLPSYQELREFADWPDDHDYLACNGWELPFVWNPEIGSLTTKSPGRHALVWCPPGGHGRYLAAVFLENGEVRSQRITVTELRELLNSPSN